MPFKGMSSKASNYSELSGSKKKGAKLRPKPNTKAEPKSNVKVVGKPTSSLKQRYPQTFAKTNVPKEDKPKKKY